MQKILEIKRHLNKPDERYWCDLLDRGDEGLVLKYVSDRPGRVGEVTFDPGSTTYAHYRTGRGYVLWKMVASRGELKGHLFHICRDQKIGDDRVEYLDLLLDVWVDPDGELVVLDRDEVEACAGKGMISDKHLAWIAAQEKAIRQTWTQMITPLNRFPI